MARDVEAGRAFVRVSLKDQLNLRKLSGKLKNWAASIAGIGTKMAALGAGMSAPFVGAIRAASDMEETMNKFNVVFGDSSKSVKAWGDEFASSVGRSKKQVADFMAGSQDLFVPLGFAADAALGLSKQVTGLAVDLASFNNMADADTLRDLHAALTGSGEVMKKYGVIVSEAAVKQDLLNQGLDPKNATNQQKVQARLNIIMRGTTAAQGDAVRSAGSFANQMKALKGNIADAAVAIGNALLPVITPLVTKAADIVKVIGGIVSENTEFIASAFKVTAAVAGIGAALVALSAAMYAAGIAIGVIASPLGIVVGLAAALTAAFVTLTETGRWLGETLMGDFAAAFDTVKATFQGVVDALKAGELQLAGEIALTGLKLAFLQGTQTIREIWTNFAMSLVDALQTAATAVLGIWRNVSQTIAGWLADLGYKVSLLVSGQKNYLTDEERTSARDSALNAYYDKLQGNMQSTVDSLGDGIKDSMDASIKDSEAKIAALRARLSSLTGTTATKVAKLPDVKPPKPHEVAQIAKQSVGVMSQMIGTFSAAAAGIAFQGARADDPAKQTAENTKLTAKAVQQIARQQASLQISFL